MRRLLLMPVAHVLDISAAWQVRDRQDGAGQDEKWMT